LLCGRLSRLFRLLESSSGKMSGVDRHNDLCRHGNRAESSVAYWTCFGKLLSPFARPAALCERETEW
jgi:hypothetical protein